ncbi:His Kinase A (phospho-acceptor) domain-containing protein [Bradyrhizobium erythrophlei]|nr:His Kinase A (phospho-acceptor) domain-containing protein [Bradyrhizobium erythrophlei]
MKWIRRVCFGGMCLLMLAKSADAADPDRVLLLHSFGPDFSPWNTITPPFREALRKLAPNPIDLYEASLQAERFGKSPAREEGPFIDYLNALMPDRKPRLIVAMGAPVTRFVLRNRARLFPSSPLLIATSDVRTYEDLALTANDTACPTIYDPTVHIDHLLRLLPDTDHIVVAMTGASATEQFWNDLFQRALQRSSRRVTLEWFTHLAADDMVKRVAALPAHSAIFYPTIRVDGRGVPQEGDALLLRFIEEDRAPIFTHTDSLFGHGIVGGPMFSSHEMADACAKVAVRLLNGETPGDIKIVPVGLAAPRYDWRQLQKWGIKDSLLPPGSEIFFREPTVWERYSWQIALTLAVILAQTGLISAMLSERRRRQLAEVQSRQRMAELARVMRFSTAGELTALIAHEINQPLGAILTNAETAQAILKSPSPDIAELNEIVVDILRDDRRANEVIRRMRSLLTKAPFELKSLDLNEVARETIEFLSAIGRQVGLVSVITPDALPIIGDRIQLQQVILNLVANGIDAMKDTSTENRIVSMRTSRVEKFAELSVSDLGSGIPEDKLKEVFEPFFTSKAEGMGMGLSIARTIIEAHNGQIWAENQARGGAVFHIRLPLATLPD